MAVRPLRPATDRRFGGPLPHQLANQTRVHPYPINLLPLSHAALWSYAVLSVVSNCCPPDKGRFPTRYSPVRHCHQETLPKINLSNPVRLACVRHAASVHPEPGSNSHVKNLSGKPLSSNCTSYNSVVLLLTNRSSRTFYERCRFLVSSVFTLVCSSIVLPIVEHSLGMFRN